VHSVDRARLVTALSDAVTAAGRRLTVLLQVSLEPAAGPGRGGALPTEVLELAAAVAAAPGLRLGGVMAVAPLGADPDAGFAQLASIAHDLRSSHPEATMISAGMSGDLEAALRHGATHLRVGTALLGDRPPVVG
jgi:hypothetical protein